jgi:hypothetical protein
MTPFDQAMPSRYSPATRVHYHSSSVGPQEVVDEGPRGLVKRASVVRRCIYEKDRTRRSTKSGCLQTILPEFGVRVKRTYWAGKYCQSWEQKAAM